MMNLLYPLIMVMGLSTPIPQATCDTIVQVYNSPNLNITENGCTGSFDIYVRNKGAHYTNVKFAKSIGGWIQVLDQRNELFYLNELGEVQSSVNEIKGVCGTVPHYTLEVRETKSYFEIWEDETFMDFGNEKPAEFKFRISKDLADEVMFIDRTTRFQFTSNFDYLNDNKVDPRLVIIKKDEKYALFTDMNHWYESIEFRSGQALISKRDGLYGIAGIFEPQFSSIEPFEHHIAKAVKDGVEMYIDGKGKIYTP